MLCVCENPECRHNPSKQILDTLWFQLRRERETEIKKQTQQSYLDVSMTTDSLFTPNLGEEVSLTDNADDTKVKTSSFIKYGLGSGPFTLIESEPESYRTITFKIHELGNHPFLS